MKSVIHLLFVLSVALLLGTCVIIAFLLTPLAIIYQMAKQNAETVYEYLDKEGYKTN